MKRVAFFLAYIMVSLSLFSSCEKETIMSIDQTSITIPNTGGSQTITLTANKPWTVSSNQSWCRISPSAGEEATSTRITITCDANTAYDARSCIVTFTCAEMSGSVNVTQAASNGLLVSQTEYNVSNAAQQLNIEVKANVKFSAEVDNGCKDWVKYNTTKGLTNSTVVLDIAKNDTYDGREGKVTIKQTDGSLSSTVTIKQGQTDGLFLTTSEYNLSNEKHKLTVEVKSNIDFDVKSEVDWIRYVETKGLKTNQIVLEIAANEAYDTREGKVTVKQKNGDLSGTIVVKQEQNYGLIVSKTEYDLSNEAQTIDVEVKYNVDFDVVIPSGCKDWIKQVSTKGLNSRTYTFSIAKNENYDARDGSITFKQKNGALSGTVSVKQSQNDGLFVTKSDYEITNESQTVNVEVKANIDFEVKSEVDWVKVVETKGLKTSTITLTIAENDSYDTRTGKVIVKQTSGDLSGTITIKQNGKNGIIIAQTEYDLSNEAQTLNVEVQSTVQFEVQISDSGKDWVSLVSTKALDTKTCSFSIKENDSYDDRQCTVTFKQKDGKMSSSFIIRQAKKIDIIIPLLEYNLSSESQTITIDVIANTEFEAKVEAEWIHIIDTKGLNTTTVTISIDENTSFYEREGVVSIRQVQGDIHKTVSIKQSSSKKSLVFVVEANFSTDYTTYLPLAGSIDCDIDWGDGTVEHYTYNRQGGYSTHTSPAEEPDVIIYTWKEVNSTPIAHKYPETGKTTLYEVRITGKVTALNSSYLTSYSYPCNSIVEVKEWGNTGLEYMCFAFIGQSKLHKLAGDYNESFKNVISFCGAFEACDALEDIPRDLFQYCSSTTDFYRCFLNSQAIKSIPEGLFRNCTNAVSMGAMFAECHALKNIPARLFEGCKKAISFSSLFNRCTSLEQIPSDIFKGATEVKYLRATFSYTSLKNIDEYLFSDNNKVISFCQTFCYCEKLESLPRNLFSKNTEVTSFESTFSKCSALNSVPYSIFDNNRKVNNFYACFSSCNQLTGESPYTNVDGTIYHLYERQNNPNYFHAPTSFDGCFKDCNKLNDYESIPKEWKTISF